MLKFEVKSTTDGRVAYLTVSALPARRSRLERSVLRQFTTECATRGLAISGEIKLEVQENWLTPTVDVTAAAFVVAAAGIATETAKHSAISGAMAPALPTAPDSLNQRYRLKLCPRICCRSSWPRAIME